MAERGRGAKTNHNKNYVAAKEFAEGKKLGRPKQVWVTTHMGDPCVFCKIPHDDVPIGACPASHWEKVKP